MAKRLHTIKGEILDEVHVRYAQARRRGLIVSVAAMLLLGPLPVFYVGASAVMGCLWCLLVGFGCGVLGSRIERKMLRSSVDV